MITQLQKLATGLVTTGFVTGALLLAASASAATYTYPAYQAFYPTYGFTSPLVRNDNRSFGTVPMLNGNQYFVPNGYNSFSTQNRFFTPNQYFVPNNYNNFQVPENGFRGLGIESQRIGGYNRESGWNSDGSRK